MMPMKHNAHYNLNVVLANNILNSRYFRGLYTKTTFQEVIDEIYYKVDNLEPFLTTIGSASNTASTAFCLLYKLFTMKLTKKQIASVLRNQDSPFVRCLGLLFLRYTLPPDQLWSYFKDVIDDKLQVNPSKHKDRLITVGEFAKKLLTEQRYFSTLLPRIPKKIETDIEVALMQQDNRRNGVVTPTSPPSDSDGNRGKALKANKKEGFKTDDLVMARFSEDGKWYEAKILKIGEKEKTWLVMYIDYGNEEEVYERHLKMLQSKEENEEEEQRRMDQLRQKVLEKKRSEVATSRRSEVAKRIGTVKSTISVAMNSQNVSRELNLENNVGRGFKSVDEALQKHGRIGELETEDLQERERKEKKRKERQKALEDLYGNVAKRSKKR